jgi:hypothetical protein
MLVLH